MPKKRKKIPDNGQDDRDLEKDIERRNQNPVSQESLQQNQGGHFGGQYEKGRPLDPNHRR